MLALVAGTLLGIIFTLMADQEPGTLLGVFIIVGSIAAALFIRRGKIYLLFPAPALAFFVGAIVAGKVHDAKLGSSTAGLASGGAQWIAGIFFPAVIATVLVLLIGGGRWVLGRQLVTTGQSPLPGGCRPAPGNARPAPSGDRPAIDDWAEDDPFEDRALHTQMIPAAKPNRPGPAGTPRPARPAREGNPGADRDPWGDPRLPADRSQPTGPRPGQGSGPRPSQGSGPRPNQGTGARPSQGSGPGPSQGSGPELFQRRVAQHQVLDAVVAAEVDLRLGIESPKPSAETTVPRPNLSWLTRSPGVSAGTARLPTALTPGRDAIRADAGVAAATAAASRFQSIRRPGSPTGTSTACGTPGGRTSSATRPGSGTAAAPRG
jgi:hypothetical protein